MNATNNMDTHWLTVVMVAEVLAPQNRLNGQGKGLSHITVKPD